MKLEELFNQYRNLRKEELVKEGRRVYSALGAGMSKKGYSQKEVLGFATMLVRLAAGADNFGSEAEFELFQAVTEIKSDIYEFKAMVRNSEEEGFVAAIDEVVDSLDKELKEAALRFAALFFAVDNHLNQREADLFKRLEA